MYYGRAVETRPKGGVALLLSYACFQVMRYAIDTSTFRFPLHPRAYVAVGADSSFRESIPDVSGLGVRADALVPPPTAKELCNMFGVPLAFWVPMTFPSNMTPSVPHENS